MNCARQNITWKISISPIRTKVEIFICCMTQWSFWHNSQSVINLNFSSSTLRMFFAWRKQFNTRNARIVFLRRNHETLLTCFHPSTETKCCDNMLWLINDDNPVFQVKLPVITSRLENQMKNLSRLSEILCLTACSARSVPKTFPYLL